MYGNVSKAGVVGAAMLPATGAVVSPWITIAGYLLVAVTLGSFVYLKRVTNSSAK